MWLLRDGELPEESIKGIRDLGPEPFSKLFTANYLKKKFLNKTRAIKLTLLDQHVIAGIGNIYADESLFKAGIKPTKNTGDLSLNEIKKLIEAIVIILKQSIKSGGTTFSDFRDLKGLNGNYGDEAFVYRRTDKPCRKCGTKIIKLKLGGRGTHWCKTCQQ